MSRRRRSQFPAHESGWCPTSSRADEVRMKAAAHRRSMTRACIAMALAAAVVTAGCSSNSDSAESQDPAALCSSLDALETSVQGLGDVTVSAEGLAALQDGLEPVKADVAQV